MTYVRYAGMGILCLTSLAHADSLDYQPLADGNRAFAFRLYQELAQEPGNLFFSPHSISTALGMTYVGAREETATQMKSTMAYPDVPEAVSPRFGALELALESIQQEGEVQWTAANSIWPHEQFVFLEEFLAQIRTHFRSDVYPVNFNEPDVARAKINAWVEEKTNDKILDLIPPGVLNPMTRMVLVNAVYFKGAWKSPFHPSVTADRPFTLADHTIVQTPTMYGKFSARYGVFDGMQALEIPYRGDRVTMTILLPGEPDGLPALESQLSSEKLSDWQSGMSQGEVQVYLPKFSLTEQFGLTATLKALGMVIPFDESSANFSGMDGNPANLFISDVIHKAFVDVTEEGTEAAAATAVLMQARSMPRPAPEFRADRPFMFVIQDVETRSVLFAGRLVEPAK
jgi:serpin B